MQSDSCEPRNPPDARVALRRPVARRSTAASIFAISGRSGQLLDGIGPITGVIHGAGILADRRIEDLTAEQFDSVYETKVDGLRNVLTSVGEQPLKLLVLFSSSTGRFGRTGQAAYAAANEALNKIANREPTTAGLPRRRTQLGTLAGRLKLANPGLANLFATEGIELIPLADGARHVLAELAVTDRATEVVVLGGGSRLPERVLKKVAMHFVFERNSISSVRRCCGGIIIDGRAVCRLREPWSGSLMPHCMASPV